MSSVTKTCTKCSTEKPLTAFCKNVRAKDGLAFRCRPCLSEDKKERRKNNLTAERARDAARWESRKVKKLEYDKQRYHRLRDQLNEKQCARYKNDIQYKLGLNLRRRMHKFVKRGDRKGSAVRDLKCSLDFFKNYIESLFKPGMGCDNYGKWHLDHIYPISLVDLTDREQFLKVAHYTNYQPLWAAENIKKGNKIL